MFTEAERPSGMGSFLCVELLDFAAAERRQAGPAALPSCEPGECPGLAHLPALARAAFPVGLALDRLFDLLFLALLFLRRRQFQRADHRGP